MSDYFKAFCNALNCEECLELAKKVEKGQVTKEQFYEFAINKHGETKILQAHQIALAETQKPRAEKKAEAKIEVKPEPVTPTPSPAPTSTTPRMPDHVMKTPTEECETCEPTEKELAEVAKWPEQKYKSQFTDICRGCVAAYTLSTFVIMEDWYTGEEKKKLKELASKVEDGTMNVEDAFFEMFKIPGAWEAFDRVMRDFNQVIEYALKRASMEIPEIRQKLAEQGLKPEDVTRGEK